jgi:hypothetical protein
MCCHIRSLSFSDYFRTATRLVDGGCSGGEGDDHLGSAERGLHRIVGGNVFDVRVPGHSDEVVAGVLFAGDPVRDLVSDGEVGREGGGIDRIGKDRAVDLIGRGLGVGGSHIAGPNELSVMLAGDGGILINLERKRGGAGGLDAADGLDGRDIRGRLSGRVGGIGVDPSSEATADEC